MQMSQSVRSLMHFLVWLGCWKNLMILQLICSHVGMSYYMQGDRKQSGKGYCIAFPLVETSNIGWGCVRYTTVYTNHITSTSSETLTQLSVFDIIAVSISAGGKCLLPHESYGYIQRMVGNLLYTIGWHMHVPYTAVCTTVVKQWYN